MNPRRRRSLGGFAVAALIGWPRCSKATAAVSRTWNIAPFSELQIDLSAHEVLIEPRVLPLLSIRAAAEVLRAVVVDQSTERRLTLRAQGFQTRVPIHVVVGYTALHRLALSCGGQVRLTGPTSSGGLLAIRLEGTTDLDATALNLSLLAFEANGTGDAHLAGQARTQRVRLNGTGQYQAAALRSESVDVWLDGVGDAVVQARQTLDVRLDGAGSVRYIGRPRVRQHGDGTGELISVHQGEKQ